jgi:hypothetical protein
MILDSILHKLNLLLFGTQSCLRPLRRAKTKGRERKTCLHGRRSVQLRGTRMAQQPSCMSGQRCLCLSTKKNKTKMEPICVSWGSLEKSKSSRHCANKCFVECTSVFAPRADGLGKGPMGCVQSTRVRVMLSTENNERNICVMVARRQALNRAGKCHTTTCRFCSPRSSKTNSASVHVGNTRSKIRHALHCCSLTFFVLGLFSPHANTHFGSTYSPKLFVLAQIQPTVKALRKVKEFMASE